MGYGMLKPTMVTILTLCLFGCVTQQPPAAFQHDGLPQNRLAYLVTADGERVPLEGVAIVFPMPEGYEITAELTQGPDRISLTTGYTDDIPGISVIPVAGNVIQVYVVPHEEAP